MERDKSGMMASFIEIQAKQDTITTEEAIKIIQRNFLKDTPLTEEDIKKAEALLASPESI